MSNHYHQHCAFAKNMTHKYKHYELIQEIEQNTFNQSRKNLDSIVSLVRDWNKAVKHSDTPKN